MNLPPGNSRREIGARAEEMARRWLEKQGYSIITNNFRAPTGEVDIVAEQGDFLCFVEVKARGSNPMVPSILAISAVKKRRLIKTASLYLQRHDIKDKTVRFDVLFMDSSRGETQFNLITDAFRTDFQ